MNPARTAELAFWRGVVAHYGAGYLAWRRSDYEWYSSRFGDLYDVAGKHGLDLGCGCVSMFHFADARSVVAVDPLVDEYLRLFTPPVDDLDYEPLDGEELPFGGATFDFVACWNVIDHTPHPECLVSEVRRVLKPGGRLYLEVNFDQVLTPEHYALWDESTIERLFSGFPEIRRQIYEFPAQRRRSFFGVFEVPA